MNATGKHLHTALGDLIQQNQNSFGLEIEWDKKDENTQRYFKKD